MTQIKKGRLIAGKYRLERRLAGGGMGSIWRGIDQQLDVPVAVKFMHQDIAENAPQRARFEREAKAAAKLRSPHVVHMYEYGIDKGTPYIVMELLEGEDLGKRLTREGQLPLDEAARIITEICKGLHRAHQRQIIHRDLKPGNIFLSAPDEDAVKILDFGIAKASGIKAMGQEATSTGQLLGSPQYMSPEQVRGIPLDGRSDLWSVGIIIYRMITGRRPFKAKEVGDLIVRICTDPVTPPSQVRPGLSAEVDAFVARALQRDPTGRFQTAKDLASAFALAVKNCSPPTVAVPEVSSNELSWDQSVSAAISSELSSSPGGEAPTVTAETTAPSAPTPLSAPDLAQLDVTDVSAVIPRRRPRALWGVAAAGVLVLTAAVLLLTLGPGETTAEPASTGESAPPSTAAPATSTVDTAPSTSAVASSAPASSSSAAPSATKTAAKIARPVQPPTKPKSTGAIRPKATSAPYSTSDLGY